MTDYLKRRWISVGFCWLAVVVLAFWNLEKIDSIEKTREKREIYLMDEQFWNYNASNISRILKKSASLIQGVESSKIGLFEFERNIRNLAVNFGLNTISLTSQSQHEQVGIIPLKLSFQSTFQQATKWFDHLESELPYAQIRDINIELDEATKQNNFTVSIYYRYSQAAQESSI